MRRGRASGQPQDWLPEQWQPSSLSENLNSRLRAGVTQAGHLGRLRQAMAKARGGKPIVMVGLGASVTSDFGGAVGYMQERYSLGYIGVPKTCRGDCVRYGWMLPVFRYLTQHGAARNINGSEPSSLVNCGQAARFVSSYIDCTASSVPENADLIIVDGSNGMPFAGRDFRPTEVVLRRLLSLPNQPAVIVLHWLDWCACGLDTCKPGPRVDRHRTGWCYSPEGFNQSWIIGRRREEGGWATLAKHYQLPTLSMRLALHPLSTTFGESTTSDGLHSIWKAPDKFTWDGLHPNPCKGTFESCTYSMLIATTLNRFFADVVLDRYDTESTSKEALPVPCSTIKARSLERSGPIVERCFGWGIDRRVPPPIANVSGWRHTTMDTAVSFDAPAHCYGSRRRAPRSAVASPPPPSLPCPNHKDGWTAFDPGSFAVFELPLSAASASKELRAGLKSSWNANLALIYLSSYEGMGLAHVTCERGCDCQGQRIDAHRSTDFISVWEQTSFPVVVHGGRARTCAIRMLLENRSTATLQGAGAASNSFGKRARPGTKFKLSSLVLRWAAEDASAAAVAGTVSTGRPTSTDKASLCAEDRLRKTVHDTAARCTITPPGAGCLDV